MPKTPTLASPADTVRVFRGLDSLMTSALEDLSSGQIARLAFGLAKIAGIRDLMRAEWQRLETAPQISREVH